MPNERNGDIPFNFEDINLQIKALEAAGASNSPEGNKRLALIGDAVLRLILYLRGYKQDFYTREMTNLQNTIATNSNLAATGFARGLDSRISVNPAQGTLVQERLMATTMEALIGAVFLGSKMDIVKTERFIIDLGLLDSP